MRHRVAAVTAVLVGSVAAGVGAGYVSLKVQGEDAAGFKATVTAINAYAVS